MFETKLRELINDVADGVPGPDPQIPRHVVVGTRRRIAMRIGAVLVSLSVIALAAVAGVRGFLADEETKPAIHPPPTAQGEITLISPSREHIVVVNLEGTVVKDIPVPSSDLSSFYPLDWSPDGSKLLLGEDVWSADQKHFIENRFYVKRDDGPFIRLMTPPQACCGRWSPDGSKILFQDNRGAIYITDSRGCENPGCLGLSPIASGSLQASAFWSPDGSRIAFLKSSGVYVVNADGSGLKKMPGTGTDYSTPAWSMDGAKIALGTTSGIYVINVDGSELTRLTDHGGNLSWSPDGSKLAFDASNVIYTINVDGTGLTRLTGNGTLPWPPSSWSPDGSKIVFIRYGAYYVMNADGSDQKLVGRSFGKDQPLLWRHVAG